MMNLEDIIKANNDKIEAGHYRVTSNRESWNSLIERIENKFKNVKEISDKDKYNFFGLYIDSNKTIPDTIGNSDESEYSNRRFVQLRFGACPTGEAVKSKTKSSLKIEKGCCLVFSEGIQGDVLVIVTPRVSESFRRKEKDIIIKVFRSPSDISDKEIEKSIKKLFSYLQVSSIYGSPSYGDRFTVFWLLALDLRNRKKLTKKTKDIGKFLFESLKPLIPVLVLIALGVYVIK